jgi:hypothetical protein
MKYIKIALLAGGLASVSSFALAQSGATAGVNFGSLYQPQTYADGNASYARANTRVHTRAVHNTANQQQQTTGSDITTGIGVGSPD